MIAPKAVGEQGGIMLENRLPAGKIGSRTNLKLRELKSLGYAPSNRADSERAGAVVTASSATGWGSSHEAAAVQRPAAVQWLLRCVVVCLTVITRNFYPVRSHHYSEAASCPAGASSCLAVLSPGMAACLTAASEF
jgi:hypothetical protein